MRDEQPGLDPRRLVFIDETAVTTKMTRLYGRAPLGVRLVAKVPHGHWKTPTLVAACRVDGVTAPYVIDGAMDGPAFLAYIEKVLVPTLRKRDIIFMDNVGTLEVAGVREGAARTVDALSRLVGRSVKRMRETHCTIRLRRLLPTRWLQSLIHIRWNML